MRPMIMALATLGVASACSVQSIPNANVPTVPTLAGAWRSRLTVRDGAFLPMKDLEFLYAFNTGGTMTESSNYDEAAPVPPAYGVWRQTGTSKFEAKYVYYVTKPPAKLQELTAGGGWEPTGYGTIVETITLANDGQSYESTIAYDLFDAAGKPAPGSGHATAHGTRIQF